VKVVQQHSVYRARQGVFGRPMAIAAAKTMPGHKWWMSFGAQTPELQKIAVRVLSQVTSAGSCERNWSTFDFIHTKKRNRLACKTVEKIVNVHCNLQLVTKIEDINYIDEYIDWSSDADSDDNVD
ncbi:hypothetical protein HELRODRAFT_182681, partial [Helobdella robusta]